MFQVTFGYRPNKAKFKKPPRLLFEISTPKLRQFGYLRNNKGFKKINRLAMIKISSQQHRKKQTSWRWQKLFRLTHQTPQKDRLFCLKCKQAKSLQHECAFGKRFNNHPRIVGPKRVRCYQLTTNAAAQRVIRSDLPIAKIYQMRPQFIS